MILMQLHFRFFYITDFRLPIHNEDYTSCCFHHIDRNTGERVFVFGIENESAPVARLGGRNSGIGLTPNEENRIYGGSDVNSDKYPYMAGLRANGSEDTSFCGGTLIAPQLVVTAAHCIHQGYLIDMYVSLGSRYVSARGSKKSEQIKVVEAFIHPLDNSTWLQYDVALLKLASPAARDPAPLCAPDGSDIAPGAMVTLVYLEKIVDNTYSETLRTVKTEITSDEECAAFVLESTSLTRCCAPEKGKARGGPRVANGVLVGIASSSGGKYGETPALYTRVSHVLGIVSGGSNGNVTEILSPSYYGSLADGLIIVIEELAKC